MSEPYCVLTRVTIGRAAVRAYLDAAWRPAATFDWRACSGFIDTESLDQSADEWSKFLAYVDQRVSGTFRDGYGKQRGAAPSPNFRFYYDDAVGTLTQASVLYAQGASELVWHLSLTRGLGQFLSGAEAGITAVHDPFFGNGTVGVFALRPGESPSVFNGRGRLDPNVAKTLDDIANELMADDAGIRDELDSFV